MRSNLLRWLRAAALLAGVVAASVMVAGWHNSSACPSDARPALRPTSPGLSPTLATGPVATTTLAPASGPQTMSLDGARRAALAYLGLSEQVVAMDPGAATAAQRDAATTAAGPGLVAELTSRLGALRAAFPAGVHYRVAPLAVRTTATGEGRARVEVAYVGVLSAPNVAPYEQWHLSSYDLAWERGAWRVAAETSGPGPRPAAPTGPEPVSAAALESALSGFGSALAP